MNNANCYALDAKAKYIYDSDSEQQYQFLGNNIVRTDKSMSLISQKPRKAPRNQEMKKSNSFLLSTKTPVPSQKVVVESKDKSKTSTKKCLNVTEVRKKQTINSKNSMTKTSVSIGNTSTKSIKSMKNRSISRDYLIIDQEIYHCENIEQVNEQLICGGSPVYSHQRFIKATLKNQQKLERYIRSFSQFCIFRKKSKPLLTDLSQSQRKKLYLLLKSQTTEHTINSQKSAHSNQREFNFQNLIKQAYNKIEEKSYEIIKQKPEQESHVKRWKNTKLHQLMEIHTCLKQEGVDQQEDIVENPTFSAINLKLDLNKNSSKQLDGFEKHQFSNSKLKFLQIQKKKPSKAENFSIRSHEAEDKYPGPQKNNSKNILKQNYLPHDHILSKDGIVSFLQNLWDYMVDSDNINQFIQNLQQPFGLSSSQKLKFFNNQSKSLPYNKNGATLIIADEIFVSFCKQNPSLSEMLADEQKHIIIFQKAIFDAFNQQLLKFETDFPFGTYHPFEDNNNSAVYLIDQSNAMVVWEQCMEKIQESHQLGLGKITENQEEFALFSDKQFKDMISQQATFYEWEIPKPLAKRSILEQVIQQIQSQIQFQFCRELQFQ